MESLRRSVNRPVSVITTASFIRVIYVHGSYIYVQMYRAYTCSRCSASSRSCCKVDKRGMRESRYTEAVQAEHILIAHLLIVPVRAGSTQNIGRRMSSLRVLQWRE